MKIGDLVQPRHIGDDDLSQAVFGQPGIVIGFKGTDVIVFWDENYPDEWEYPEQLEVINESR
jgi:hypothetical protein